MHHSVEVQQQSILSDFPLYFSCTPQCETLEDMKMNLQETDYDQFMSNEQHITPASFREKALQKLVQEMDFLRAHAVEPLATFLDYISYEFMIDNVMLLLKGTLSGRSANELIKQCNPLGLFKESTMRSIPTFEASPKGYADLYQTVLIDTPVGPYFSQYLEDSAEHLGDASEMRNILEEVQIEVGGKAGVTGAGAWSGPTTAERKLWGCAMGHGTGVGSLQ